MAVTASEHKLHVSPSRIWLSVAFLCMLPFTNLAQSCTIIGKVIDSKTSVPLPFASVYLNNTTIGTATNLEGEFTLEKLPLGEYELIVSFVGYRSYQSKIRITPFTTINMTVNLLPIPVNLNAVNVSSQKDNEWRILLEKFKKLLFGNSPYTSSCKIFNPWVLDFDETQNGVLMAKALAPLEIENPGLGYRITYQLTTFIADNNSYNIKGFVRFHEMETVDTALIKLWSKRRADVYLQSHRHLFKSMVDEQVEQQGFQLFEDVSRMESIVRRASFNSNVNENIRPFNDSAMVVMDSTTQRIRIKLPPRLEVHYTRKTVPLSVYRSIPYPISWIEVKGGYLETNHAGIVLNSANMIVSGAMGESRVAEILPYDYVPPSSNNSDYENQNWVYKKLSAIANLVEQPYIHTDRSYYYPNELLHYKIFMNYVSPLYSDSLSHVIHIELVNSSGKIVTAQTLPIVDRTANGNMLLPTEVAPGDYILRAYTRWMLNFDSRYIFNKPFKILASNQLVETPSSYDSASIITERVQVNTDSNTYKTREKILMTIEVKDSLEYPIASNVSVSVTDLQQVSPVENEQNILSNFPINEMYLPDSSFRNTPYTIQYGVDFRGHLVNKRNKPKKGALTVFQENVNDVFAIITDAEGKFKHELQFYDSLEFLVQATTEKRRKGKVILDQPKISPPFRSVEPLKVEVYTVSDASQFHLSSQFERANMLEEVTVNATKITTENEPPLLQSDFRIDGEWLRNSVSQDLLSAIQSKVPGLRVLNFLQDGMIKKYLVFSSSIYSNGSLEECLVELDGIVLTALGGESVADQLASMSVNEIESIDVIKYAGGAGYGARGSNGVIIVKTVNGGQDQSTKKTIDRRKLQTVKLKGFTTPTEFNFPEYPTTSINNDRVDSRATIYWNPNVITNGKEPATISFYAADIPTEYRIVVEGIDSNGKPVRGEKIIQIIPNL